MITMEHKPTDKQREWLAKKGVPASEVSKMSFDDAKKKLDELFGKNPGSTYGQPKSIANSRR